MEVRDPVHGSIELTPPEVAVIDSLAFQRLRSIKQLGFSEFSFPGATHNRFLHSLGVSHLAGMAFDSIFKDFAFQKSETKWRLRQTVRLAALLHDVGHGPLSHSTEEVMPTREKLGVSVYSDTQLYPSPPKLNERADHEDYTIQFVTDSHLSEILKEQFKDISPIHIASLIDKSLQVPDDFFIEGNICLRNILSQIVSSETDDRIFAENCKLQPAEMHRNGPAKAPGPDAAGDQRDRRAGDYPARSGQTPAAAPRRPAPRDDRG